MKRTGIINAPLAGRLARLGHTNLVVVAGLPVPARVPVVALAIVFGLPRFSDVLRALLSDIVIEHEWVSVPTDDTPAGAWVDAELDVPAERIPHAGLKAVVGRAQLVVRTGEDTAYADVVLQCGVPFAV